MKSLLILGMLSKMNNIVCYEEASSCSPFYIIILALLAYQASTQELSSTLHSTVYGAQIVFVDERVVFTCVVRQSNSMAWRSDEYIGSGQRLSLSSAQRVNHSVSALGNNQTVAVLVNATTGTNSVVMSELHIRVKSTYPVASVQCVNSGTNTVTSTSFFLAGMTFNIGNVLNKTWMCYCYSIGHTTFEFGSNTWL